MATAVQKPPTGEKAQKPRQTVTHEQFVKAWREAHAQGKTTAAVCTATGLAPVSVAARAKKLRAAGVILPDFPRQRQTIDVAALNAIQPTEAPPAHQ